MRGSKMTLDLDINQEEVGFKLRQNTNTEDAGEQRKKKKKETFQAGNSLSRAGMCVQETELESEGRGKLFSRLSSIASPLFTEEKTEPQRG
jgi:hypothetical protein